MGLLKPDPNKSLVFGRHVRYNGKLYYYGDAIPDLDKLSQREVEKMYRTGIFVHPRQEPKKEAPEEIKQEESEKEFKEFEYTQDEPKKTKKKKKKAE